MEQCNKYSKKASEQLIRDCRSYNVHTNNKAVFKRTGQTPVEHAGWVEVRVSLFAGRGLVGDGHAVLVHRVQTDVGWTAGLAVRIWTAAAAARRIISE